MTTSNGIVKQPYKAIEIPLNKFKDEAIPHHMKIFEQHKNNVQKLISGNKYGDLNRTLKEREKAMRQIKTLEYELDTLRSQVENADLNKFDENTFSLRRSLSGLIKDYATLQKTALQFTDSQNQINENIENENPFHGASQIQIKGSLRDIKLQNEENRLKLVENLEEDIKDLHGIYTDLNTMVSEQVEVVDQVETNVEQVQEDVATGNSFLRKATGLKAATYPASGALMGGLLGGPVGFAAGFKIGVVAAVVCSVAGFAGGNFFKKCKQSETDEVKETKVDEVPINVKRIDKKEK